MVDHGDAWFKTTAQAGEVLYSGVNYEVSEDINSVDNDSLDKQSPKSGYRLSRKIPGHLSLFR